MKTGNELSTPDERILIENFTGEYFSGDWNGVMQGVRKIASLHSQHPFEVAEFCNEYHIGAKINIVYKAVVEFIKWYNTQKQ